MNRANQTCMLLGMIFMLAMIAVASASLFLFQNKMTLESSHFGSFHNTTQTTDLPGTSCGHSRQEAISKECVFDLMSFTWVPPTCYDPELTKDFLSLQSWTWYHDSTAEHPADEVLVRGGEFEDLWVTWEYHLTHCVYMWSKMQRAVTSGSAIDDYIGNWHHTKHCLKELAMEGIKPETINTRILTKYPTCSPTNGTGSRAS